MKKLLLPIILVFAINGFSQETFFGVGIMQSTFKNENINKIFERYNENGPGYFEPYNHIAGPVFDVSIRDDGYMASIGFASRKKNIVNEYYDTLNVSHEIYLQARYGFWFVNYYWHLVDKDRFKMGPGIGGAVSLYRFQRTNTDGDHQYPVYDVIREFHFLTSVLFNMSIYMGEHASLNIQPYFQMPFLSNTLVNYAYLENNLNPNYAIPDEQEDDYLEWHINYGFTLSLSFGGE
ncbi:MAG: hypothetical protein C0596_12270 [Marinilabiliales bacterium]|nr:MAG: hypothetical protein C0596_12270 [Marinilabiliales bacterium]